MNSIIQATTKLIKSRSVQSCKIRKEALCHFSTSPLPTPPASKNTSYPQALSPSPSDRDYVEGPTTHFGFEDVPIDQKESKVRSVFQNVAESYDVMNDLMSGGLHRYWKDELLSMTGVVVVSYI